MSSKSKKAETVPVFPLPNVVFFPKTFLPLHVFEPRYRRMVEDSLAGEKRIAMALLKEGWEHDYFGTPEVHPIGCVGEIYFNERLENGRFNILLYGLSRVKVMDFVGSKPYRVARVQYLKDVPFSHDDFNVNYEATRFVHLVRQYLKELGVKDQDEILKLKTQSFESMINQVASALDFTTAEKQRLLVLDSLEMRYDLLRELIEEKLRLLLIARNVKHVPEDPRLN